MEKTTIPCIHTIFSDLVINSSIFKKTYEIAENISHEAEIFPKNSSDDSSEEITTISTTTQTGHTFSTESETITQELRSDDYNSSSETTVPTSTQFSTSSATEQEIATIQESTTNVCDSKTIEETIDPNDYLIATDSDLITGTEITDQVISKISESLTTTDKR